MNENLQNDKELCFPHVALTRITLSRKSWNNQFNKANIICYFWNIFWNALVIWQYQISRLWEAKRLTLIKYPKKNGILLRSRNEWHSLGYTMDCTIPRGRCKNWAVYNFYLSHGRLKLRTSSLTHEPFVGSLADHKGINLDLAFVSQINLNERRDQLDPITIQHTRYFALCANVLQSTTLGPHNSKSTW